MKAETRDVPNSRFRRDGQVRRLHRERAAPYLFGQTALLTQVAHPFVAQGVIDRSELKTNPLGRLRGTVGVLDSVIFGTEAEVVVAARGVNHKHKKVTGTLDHDVGKHKKGTEYEAMDPKLLLWVWASLVDTAIRGYDTFVERLHASEKILYYHESKLILPRFGCAVDQAPNTYAEFKDYMVNMIAEQEVAVSPHAKDTIAPIVLLQRPVRQKPIPISLPLMLPGQPLARLTAGLIREPLRQQYGLACSERDQDWFDKMAAKSRKIFSESDHLPNVVRFSRAYRRSERMFDTLAS